MNQNITPELRSWIVEQAQAGFAPEIILNSMKAAGWKEPVALQALESTLRDHLARQSAGRTLQPSPVVATAPVQPAAAQHSPTHAVPSIDLSQSPREIALDDRTVRVISSMNLPRVVVLGGFLSDEECDALIADASPRMARSLTVETKTGGESLNPDRTSNGMFFNRGESALLQRIEARIARLIGWPVENGEGMQVLHYKPGAEYKAHYDYFDPAEPGTPSILKRGGQRVGTLLMYLNNPLRGGGTTFPDAGLEVMPQRGHAVFFSYDRPDPGTRSLHGGAPVLEGEKWIATKWLRQREFQ
ncbi:MAG: 2OG-Fe(II) oxygenase [Hydrogenophaga sp.]|jgi:prolyl 4-hydroxylase|nr:2OG-Fe(II) oxygenase [Hydrogenophaga sp.]